MDGDIAGSIILQVVLLAINAVFACAEVAVFSCSEAKLEKMAQEGNKKANRLLRLTRQPARFLSAVQVAMMFSCFLAGTFAADHFSGKIVKVLMQMGISLPKSVLEAGSVVILALFLSFVTVLFGEVIPRRIAMEKTEKIALGLSLMVDLAAKIFAPLIWLLNACAYGILRLCGMDPNAEKAQVTEEEIRMMVDAGSEKGAIDNEEKDMIQNVFEFDDITIDEICTHRTDVDLLWMEDSIEDWEETIHESRHSYYPVCGENVDDIIGVLDAKDYFRLRSKDRDYVRKEAVKQPYFVPENIKAATLFRNMKKTGNYFALVLDEYGGMDGIVTVRDLIEQLVGDLTDETELGMPKEIEQISSDTWKIMGSTSLDDVAEHLNISLPVEEYETFGGYIFGELGAVPDDGSQFELETDDLRIKVMRVKEHRVENTIVKKISPEVQKDPEEEQEHKEQ